MELPAPVPCPVQNHASLNTVLLIGDGGLVWRECPYCNVMVEGALHKGVVVGPASGPGRGTLSYRQELRLVAWAGWSDHLGGG